jgi:5-methylcytosine-specific restriction endonuclease McrA
MLAPAQPNVVERKRGSAGVRDRERIRKRDCGLCQNCGRLGKDVDHDVPLWAGGTDDDENKRVLCGTCHDAKSKIEARQRANSAYDRAAVVDLMRLLAAQRGVA